MTYRQSTYGVDAEHFRCRVLQDALTEALAGYWETRARTLLAACSQPGDFLGRATPEQVAERDQRLRDDAERCLRHAAVIRSDSAISADVTNVLAEVC
jgi:hypothetical protein